MLQDSYPYYLNNRPEQPNTDLEVIDKYSGEVATRVALADAAAIDAGIPVEATAVQVNQLCGSGLRTVAMGMQSIKLGDTDVVVAGGQESMSQAPHCAHLRKGHKIGDLSFIDTMIKDGLWDAFNGYHMGNTAENVAEKYQITREQQDEFAVASKTRSGKQWRREISRTRSFLSPL